jgi:hypothetical protein
MACSSEVKSSFRIMTFETFAPIISRATLEILHQSFGIAFGSQLLAYLDESFQPQADRFEFGHLLRQLISQEPHMLAVEFRPLPMLQGRRVYAKSGIDGVQNFLRIAGFCEELENATSASQLAHFVLVVGGRVKDDAGICDGGVGPQLANNSKPSIVGMRMSAITTFGNSFRTLASPSSPSDASMTLWSANFRTVLTTSRLEATSINQNCSHRSSVRFAGREPVCDYS